MLNFNWMLDGSIVGLYILISLIVGLLIRKYVKNVDDFLVAGRSVDLYVGMASLAATEFGIITCMAAAQLGYKYGFSGATVGLLMAIIMFTVGKTGFCIEPLRKAGVVTIPEFFEKKFGKKVRWATGVVIVLGGLLNMGVFLRTGGEFLVYVAGLNPRYLEITMTILLLIVALYTIFGGMLSVLVTDYMQFLLMSVGLTLTTFIVFYKIGWNRLFDTVIEKYGEGGLNPFLNPNLGWQYVLYTALVLSATVLTWQTMVSRVLSAKNEKVAKKMYTRTSFFYIVRSLIPVIWGVTALTLISLESVGGAPIKAMPKMLSALLPSGVIGILVAAMLAADMSTDSSYLLGWASVIYNDILIIIHKNSWKEKKAIFVNRVLVALIGVFLLLYGLWYPLKSDLWVYMTLTATIYSVSVSTLLIAACYWEKANEWGAYAAIIIGALTPISFLVAQQVEVLKPYADKIGPYYSGIASFVFTWIAMIIGSYLKNIFSKKEVK
ncbi:sodium:solute symporter family protein [Streptobacillus moniliformis]|uniref:sodium:solute symporter family protein n=1 Tax=Streptobacillus moniliformis TaxID=34105 RepID=UPI0018C86CF1|nr:sodium:solute symporter family protein [Streptobacillus moniliformis]